jgi:hypothetical protein
MRKISGRLLHPHTTAMTGPAPAISRIAMVSRPLTAELVPRGMAQEILSRQSLRLLGGSRFVGQLAQRYLTRRMAGAGTSGQPDPFGCVLLA